MPLRTGGRGRPPAAPDPDLYRAAFSESACGMLVADPDGRLLEVNRALCEIAGLGPPELVGSDLAAIGHSENRGADVGQARALLRGEIDSYRLERRLVHGDGHAIWIGICVALARREDGTARYLVGQVEDISERKRFEARLAHLADHDSLTGLLNRRAFGLALDRAIAYGRRYGHTSALLVMDVDRLEEINELLGRPAGDRLIARVADLLQQRLRTTDVLGRVGGDEFAVLLPETDRSGAEHVADELLESVRVLSVVTVGDGPVHPSASIGVVLVEPSAAISADEVLARADGAMYDAKDAGRDRVCFAGAPGGALL